MLALLTSVAERTVRRGEPVVVEVFARNFSRGEYGKVPADGYINSVRIASDFAVLEFDAGRGWHAPATGEPVMVGTFTLYVPEFARLGQHKIYTRAVLSLDGGGCVNPGNAAEAGSSTTIQVIE
jgi:hypothetical protein